MAFTVTFGPGGRRDVGGHTVYLKRNLLDPWVPYTAAHCTECTWACAPTMPTASVTWFYGLYKEVISNDFADEAKLNVTRWYIKIIWNTDISFQDPTNSTRTWYGVVADIEDERAGHVVRNGVKYETGRQILHCYGTEWLLDQQPIAFSHAITETALHLEVPACLTFNERGFGNRSDVEIPVPGFVGIATYLFDGREEDFSSNDRPHFDNWSTRDIVNYITKWQCPSLSTSTYDPVFTVTVDDEGKLSDKDAPVVHTEGRTALDVLYGLIDRRRLMSFYVTCTEPESGNGHFPHLVPFTFTANPITPAGTDPFTIRGNDDQCYIKTDTDELTVAATRELNTKHFDRITVRGAKRTSTMTLTVQTDEFEPWWSTAAETAYKAGASGVAGYAGWDKLKQKERNEEVRGKSSLRAVYSWFKIPASWDGLVTYHSGASSDFAFPADDLLGPEDQYWHNVYVLPELRLWEGVDYSGTKIAAAATASPWEWVLRHPMVIFKEPVAGRFVLGKDLGKKMEGTSDPTGDGSNNRWGAYVRTQPYNRVVEVIVSGEPQHVIASDSFTPLAVDRDLGGYCIASKKMLVTVTLAENRHVEGWYPARGAGESTLIETQRAQVIYAGDEYRADYVVPGTAVDVDADGTLLTSTTGGYVQNDSPRLGEIARIAYEWYLIGRRVLLLSTRRLVGEDDLFLGLFVLTVGDSTIPGNTHYQSINSPITEITIRNPLGRDTQVPEPTMTVTTGQAELDALSLVPPVKRNLNRRGR